MRRGLCLLGNAVLPAGAERLAGILGYKVRSIGGNDPIADTQAYDLVNRLLVWAVQPDLVQQMSHLARCPQARDEFLAAGEDARVADSPKPVCGCR